uniref:RING-type E3 ubiquitin transferase n=1 Tax=Spongospora subterranea TaxID=70186 RepID=A0A0H5RBA2_9EUKA|eukprot:CRZ11086.1 hypothetical protein [Spongospora subterranea]
MGSTIVRPDITVSILLLFIATITSSQLSPYPSQISGLYHGLWLSQSFPKIGDHEQMVMQIIHEDDDQESTRKSWVDTRGGVVLRGSGGHDDAFLPFSGVYQRSTGILKLFSNTPDWRKLPDVVSITGDPGTADDPVASEPPLNPGEPISSLTYADSCAVEMSLLTLPLMHSPHYRFDSATKETVWRQGSLNSDQPTIIGAFLSPSCHFNLTTVLSVAKTNFFVDRASRFAIVASSATIVQMLMTLEQVQTGTNLSSISLLTIAILALLDSYMCVVHVALGMRVPDLWLSFIILTMIEFLLFSVFQVRLIFSVWKSNNRMQFDSASQDDRRHMINQLHSKLFIFILIGLIVVLFSVQNYEKLVIVILHSPWIAQIVYSVMYDVHRGFLPKYLVVMASCRLFLPLYKFGNPYNYMENACDYTFCFCLIIWVACQVGMILLQDRLGPRFFVPDRFKPAKYDYWKNVSPSSSDTCAICMMDFQEDVESDVPQEEGAVMLTPCGHVFHSICLITWMEQKMECPNCRAPLPTL